MVLRTRVSSRSWTHCAGPPQAGQAASNPTTSIGNVPPCR